MDSLFFLIKLFINLINSCIHSLQIPWICSNFLIRYNFFKKRKERNFSKRNYPNFKTSISISYVTHCSFYSFPNRQMLRHKCVQEPPQRLEPQGIRLKKCPRTTSVYSHRAAFNVATTTAQGTIGLTKLNVGATPSILHLSHFARWGSWRRCGSVSFGWTKIVASFSLWQQD